MKVWGVMPLLAIAVVTGVGVHPTASHQAAATDSPAVTLTPGLLHAVPIDTPRPVLSQTGLGQWTTTVVLIDVPSCNYLSTVGTLTHSGVPLAFLSLQDGPRRAKTLWELVAQAGSRSLTIPSRTAQVAPVAAATSESGTSTTASSPTASSCDVTLTFADLPQVPEAASLAFNDADVSFDIPLTVSREIPPILYLVIPFAGFIFLYIVILSIFLLRRTYNSTHESRIPKIRRIPVVASSAWTIRDSWATNITSGIVVVGAILASTPDARSLFPGVALSQFVLMSIVAAGIVLAAPAIFGIFHAWLDRNNLGLRQESGEFVKTAATSNTITASLATVLVTAAVTLFGIGAEIGTAIALVFLSEASTALLIVMLIGVTLATVLLLSYSAAALRSLADRAPGSILASSSDTSFTL
jgi:hypothetical protein